MVTISINMDKKCAECRKGGAAQNGICLKCMTKAMSRKPMKSPQGQAVQRAFLQHADKVRKGFGDP